MTRLLAIDPGVQPLGIEGHWIGVRDADPRAVALYRRHYSAKNPARPRFGTNYAKFCGPGRHSVYLTTDGLALWVWRLSKVRRDGQTGIECSIFRNEGPLRSSDLIREAMDLAWSRWPGQRLFTYVWDTKVKSVNPGYCFKMADWKACGRNADGRLTILECWP